MSDFKDIKKMRKEAVARMTGGGKQAKEPYAEEKPVKVQNYGMQNYMKLLRG